MTTPLEQSVGRRTGANAVTHEQLEGASNLLRYLSEYSFKSAPSDKERVLLAKQVIEMADVSAWAISSIKWKFVAMLKHEPPEARITPEEAEPTDEVVGRGTLLTWMHYHQSDWVHAHLARHSETVTADYLGAMLRDFYARRYHMDAQRQAGVAEITRNALQWTTDWALHFSHDSNVWAPALIELIVDDKIDRMIFTQMAEHFSNSIGQFDASCDPKYNFTLDRSRVAMMNVIYTTVVGGFHDLYMTASAMFQRWISDSKPTRDTIFSMYDSGPSGQVCTVWSTASKIHTLYLAGRDINNPFVGLATKAVVDSTPSKLQDRCAILTDLLTHSWFDVRTDMYSLKTVVCARNLPDTLRSSLATMLCERIRGYPTGIPLDLLRSSKTERSILTRLHIAAGRIDHELWMMVWDLPQNCLKKTKWFPCMQRELLAHMIESGDTYAALWLLKTSADLRFTLTELKPPTIKTEFEEMDSLESLSEAPEEVAFTTWILATLDSLTKSSESYEEDVCEMVKYLFEKVPAFQRMKKRDADGKAPDDMVKFLADAGALMMKQLLMPPIQLDPTLMREANPEVARTMEAMAEELYAPGGDGYAAFAREYQDVMRGAAGISSAGSSSGTGTVEHQDVMRGAAGSSGAGAGSSGAAVGDKRPREEEAGAGASE